MDGWVSGGMNEDQAGALRGTQKVDAHNVAKQIGTDHSGRTEEERSRRTRVSALPCVSDSVISAEVKTKTKTDGTKQLPTAPAARGNAIVRGLVSTY